MSTTIGAVVAHEPQDGHVKWQYEKIAPPRHPKEHEVLVRIAAVGICHTDLFVSSLPTGAIPGLAYPKILGHEGAGYIEAVGPGVTVGAKGDPVLLSYNYCDSCGLCSQGDISYCEKFDPLNHGVGDHNLIFKTQEGKEVAGKFFGQSSFAALTLVDERSIVNVKELINSPEELKRCAPLGCGLMTGCGSVLKNCKADDILIVAGLGAVGIGAVLGAKQVKCKTIIAVDRVESRLALAKEFGATHIYNTADKDPANFVQEVRELAGGQRITRAIDTTAVIPVIQQLLLSLGKRGKLIQIGVPPPTETIPIQVGDFFFGTKIYETNYLGDARATDLVPQMVKLYQQGEFPIDKISKFYSADQIQEALADMKSKVIKPILVFD